MTQISVERARLIALLVVYLSVGTLFAVRTPAWQAPDEPAHYNYVAQVATNGCCPVLEAGDWDSAYLDTIKGARFAPETLDRFAAIQYEDHQPPLYYLLASLVFKLTDGSLIALRLFSVLIGAGVVIGAYAVAKTMLPDQPQIALGTAALVAFVPQHVAMLAAVNNDGLAELIVALALWGIVVYLKTGQVKAWHLGIVVGLGLLTKVSTLFLAGLVPLAIVVRWWIRTHLTPNPSPNSGRGASTSGSDRCSDVQQSARSTSIQAESTREFAPSPEFGGGMGRGWNALFRALILFALPALLLGAIWWARDLSIYGFPDLFGLARHNAVVVGQMRTADLIASVGAGEYLRRGVELTFQSFWGMFGWMASGLPGWAYPAILLVLGAAAVGLAMRGWMDRRAYGGAPLPREQMAAWAIMIVTAGLAVLQYLYYNTEFVQFQGRYMYPGLIPLGLFVALGLDGWRVILGRAAVRPYMLWFAPAVIALLIPLDLYAIWRIIPGLAP